MFTKTLLPDTFRAIKLVSTLPEIQTAYLAGGTSLTLQIGHRISVALDFFTREHFVEAELSEKLIEHAGMTTVNTSKWSIWGTIQKTKFSMFYYKYPLLEQTELFEGIKLAHLADIAAMKIHAIESRGTKRDFTDVYFLAKHFSLGQMIDYYQKKYNALDEHTYSILRSLDYFEDADSESEMPHMLVDVNWNNVKEFFKRETNRVTKNMLQPTS